MHASQNQDIGDFLINYSSHIILLPRFNLIKIKPSSNYSEKFYNKLEEEPNF